MLLTEVTDLSRYVVLEVRLNLQGGLNMSLTADNGHSLRVGCAYYDPVQASIYVLEDTQETSHFDLTKMG